VWNFWFIATRSLNSFRYLIIPKKFYFFRALALPNFCPSLSFIFTSTICYSASAYLLASISAPSPSLMNSVISSPHQTSSKFESPSDKSWQSSLDTPDLCVGKYQGERILKISENSPHSWNLCQNWLSARSRLCHGRACFQPSWQLWHRFGLYRP